MARDQTPPIASVAQRLVAGVLDAAIAAAVTTPIVMLVMAVTTGPAQVYVGLGLGVGVLAVAAAFDGSARGATPGKRLVGLRVVARDSDSAIGLSRGLLRRLAFVAGGLPFYAGWLLLVLDRQREALHDKVAGSRVVAARRKA